MSESTCRECGVTIRYETPAGASAAWLRFMAPRVCEACAPAVEARAEAERIAQERRDAAERRAEREKAWPSICPPRYLDTDPMQLSEEAMFAIASWQYGAKGLGLVGPTGRRKTRSIFLLLRRLYVDEGRRVMYLTTPEFSHRVSRLSGEKMIQLDEFIDNLCRVPVLFLDDLGKGRMTDRVESEFYHVIEQRSAHLRPIMFTANATAAELAKQLGDDRGVPIMRRLADYCEVVKL